MQIPCPCCGLRAMSEFSYGGTELDRPGADVTDADWDVYVYRRDNPDGPHRELWFHAAGCRRWFAVVRDTRSNVFLTGEAP